MNVDNNISCGQPNFKAMNIRCKNVSYSKLGELSEAVRKNPWFNDLCEFHHVNLSIIDKGDRATLQITQPSGNVLKRLLGIPDKVGCIKANGSGDFCTGYKNIPEVGIYGKKQVDVHYTSGMQALIDKIPGYMGGF